MPKRFGGWKEFGRALLLVLLTGATAAPATAQTVYALLATSSAYKLLSFQATSPRTFTATATITGIASGQQLISIDARPATGQLFGLGYNTNRSEAQLYTLDVLTGAATAVGTPFSLSLGSVFVPVGFDFDPTTDRIRVTSSSGGNYRLDPVTGTVEATDPVLAYASDDAHAGQPAAVSPVAHTNSYVGASATTLYAIDGAAERLLRLTPTDGTLHTVAALSGILHGNATTLFDLDIASSPGASSETAYLVVETAGNAGDNSLLCALDLATGQVTALGDIGGTSLNSVINIAVAIPNTVTATRPTVLATGLTLFPNPLAEAASLRFTLPRAGRVTLLVSDALGRPVDALDAGSLPAGPATLRWSRSGQAAGLYYFRLLVNGEPAGTRAASLVR